jgi:hypothetical protein
VRSLGVVVADRTGEDYPSLADGEEQLLVQQFVYTTVEAHDKPDLRRPFDKLSRALPGEA